MREKPIQKEHIACRAGERKPWHVGEHLWRDRKFPVGALPVGERLLIPARQHFQRPVGVSGIDQWYPAGQDDGTALIRRILMPGTPGLRKTRDIHPHADDLPGYLPWGHESHDVVHQPRMLCQAGDTRVMVRIGKDRMDERYRISPVLLCDAL